MFPCKSVDSKVESNDSGNGAKNKELQYSGKKGLVIKLLIIWCISFISVHHIWLKFK